MRRTKVWAARVLSRRLSFWAAGATIPLRGLRLLAVKEVDLGRIDAELPDRCAWLQAVRPRRAAPNGIDVSTAFQRKPGERRIAPRFSAERGISNSPTVVYLYSG